MPSLRPLTPLLLALALLLAAPATGYARPGQLALFQDDRQLLNSGPEQRERALDEIQRLGADAIKLQLPWHAVAPGGRFKPPGFDGSRLDLYPAAGWERFDGLIQAADRRGLDVLVALSPPAPGWATTARGDILGVERPSPREYGRWVRAVGTRYDGRRVNARGEPLPRVDFWSIWNEPNHPLFLLPLGSRRRGLIAPHHYRELVRSAVGGLRLSGHGRDTVLFGELLPIGRRDVGPRKTIKPVAFLREFFCLDPRFRPFRGAEAARRPGCRRFRRIAGVTGFAYHPYTRPDGPQGDEPTRDDATIRSLSRIGTVLDRAAARRRLARRGLPIHVTEFGYQSNPPDPNQSPIRRIPGFLAEAEWLAWRNRRVATWSQYGLVDDPLSREVKGPERYRLFQSALRFEDGSVKGSVYDAYRLPIFVRRGRRGRVEIWGTARPATPGQLVEIQASTGGGPFATLPGGRAFAGFRGYFRRTLRPGAARSFRLRYVDPAGVERLSRTAQAGSR